MLANAAIVPAGTGGAVNVYASNDTDLVIDVNGYFTPPAANSLQFYPLTPCRVAGYAQSERHFRRPIHCRRIKPLIPDSFEFLRGSGVRASLFV